MEPQYPLPWYKKTLKYTLLIIGWFLAGAVTLIALLTAYYFIQIKLGNGDQIARQFQTEQFTVDQNALSTVTTEVPDNIHEYVRNQNPTFGNQDAAITILMFKDFECPFCQAAHPEFSATMQRFEPAIKVVFKHFPVAAIHPNAINAGNAASCATEQGKFWEYYNALFTQKILNQTSLYSYAEDIGLDETQFDACYVSSRHHATMNADYQDGIALGVRGTPTYFVNNKKIEGQITAAQWEQIILEELKSL